MSTTEALRALDNLESYFNRESYGFEQVQKVRAALAATSAPAEPVAISAQALALCHAIEEMPACEAQTTLVLMAFKVYRAAESIEKHGEIRHWVFDTPTSLATSAPSEPAAVAFHFRRLFENGEVGGWGVTNAEKAAVFKKDPRFEVRPLYAVPQPAPAVPQPEAPAEPVAWCSLTKNGKIAYFDGRPMIMPGPVGNEVHDTPLYPTPPAAEVEERRELSDAALLDWLETKVVNVRDPLVYGSRQMFLSSPDQDDPAFPAGPSDLRKRIAAAILAKSKEKAS
jgi:hypothetical protein